MNAAVTSAAARAAHDEGTAKDHAALIAEHFRQYNEEFGRITRRAALNFLAEDWHAGQLDAVARIELYELRVARAVAAVADRLRSKRTDVALWIEIKRAYEMTVARRPDSDFYRTFFNSVTRDLFGTVGVNKEVEFCATSVGRASGAVPIRVYRVGGSLPTAVREVLSDLPFGAAIADTDAAVHRISAEIGRYFQTGRQSGPPESIELIEPLFYRGMRAFVVGRLIGDGSITPLVLSFTNSSDGVQVDAVMLSRADVGSLFGYARSYFHVDLPVVSAAITLLRSCPASPSMSCTPCWGAPSRARPSVISPCSATWTSRSTVSCTRRETAASS
jgi:isocitrate dehydrogenase kinase/phosphatase